MTDPLLHRDLPGLAEQEIVDWLRSDKRSTDDEIGLGSQASLYLFDNGRYRLIIKRPKGILFYWLRQSMIRKEHGIYRMLDGVHGIPRCYGLIKGRYLVLEYIDAVDLRHATLNNRSVFLDRLFKLILAVHERGVAHGDLKRKDNILVVDGEEPVLVDFGVATYRRRGFRPINKFVHDTLRQMDMNAWLKHKYGRGYEGMSEEDRTKYHPTAIERIFDVLDRPYHLARRAVRRVKARLA